MRSFTIPTLSFLSALVVATPTPRARWSGDDLQVLNFALTVERLENAFYQDRLDKYSHDDFLSAGLPGWARNRWIQIQEQEQVHVDFLTTAIEAANAKAVKACKYKFPDRDPMSFSRTSLNLETIGVSAWNGVQQYLRNKDYLTASGSVMTVEAGHASWVNSAILKKNPWNTPLNIPLTPLQASTIIANFIEWCPPENAALLPPGVTTILPQLTVVDDLWPGQKGRVKYPGVEAYGDQHYWVIIKTGVGELPAKLEKDGWFFVPKEATAKGATYIFITSDDGPVNDDNIVAGPALVVFDFDSLAN